jgi:hypothetical protein
LFEAPDAFVLDEFGVAHGGEFGLDAGQPAEKLRAGGRDELGDGFDVEIERIAEVSADGQIGAGVEGLAIVDGVERIEPDHVDAEVVGGPLGEGGEISEVAGAPVAGGLETVEADGEAGHVGGRIGRLINLVRADDPLHGCALGGIAVEGGAELVIAEGHGREKLEGAADEAFAGDCGAAGNGEVAEAPVALFDLAVFQADPEAEASVVGGVGGHADGGRSGGRPRTGDQSLRQEARPLAEETIAEEGIEGVERVDGNAEGLEDGGADFGRGGAGFAPVVDVFGLEAIFRGGAGEGFVAGGGGRPDDGRVLAFSQSK